MDASERSRVVLVAIVLLTFGTTGCLATRKYVQSQAIQPLGVKIQDEDKKIDTKTSELDSRVTDLDRETERGISNAQHQAEEAEKHAQGANQAALGAQQTADKGVTLANTAQNQIDNIDNYQQVKMETVLFGFNRAELTDEDKQQLEGLTQSLAALKHYAIEVEGFTDQTGPKQYNLELSRRRADAVVRYLTENGQVPLVKIHMLGFGEDKPASDNNTSDGRKQNRRVEVRIMAPEFTQTSAAVRQSTTASVPTPQ